MFRWWRKWQDRERRAEEDATILIARFGTRASYIASRRAAQMRNGAVLRLQPPPLSLETRSFHCPSIVAI
jgi:hypothetical protein